LLRFPMHTQDGTLVLLRKSKRTGGSP
jgi:hypothetical protein